MSKLSLLQKLNSKIIALPDATATARAAGELADGDEVVARIRKVSGRELIASAGATPLLYALARERQEGESIEEFAQRLQARVLEDPQLMMESRQQDLQNTRAQVALGVTGLGFRRADGGLELDQVHLELDGDATVDLLAGDFDVLVEAIQSFSSGGRRVGGADQTAAFPQDAHGDHPDADGEGVREDADGVPAAADS